jgi:hypothetical protein
VAAQAPDRLGYGRVNLVSEVGHEDERFDDRGRAVTVEGRSAGQAGEPGRLLAVKVRALRRELPGGCSQPASACHVHHVRHKARGGKTSVKDCVLLCAFHHLVAIHRWGWTLALNGDGTTMAWNKDHTKVLRSHSPPTARAG